MDWIKPNSCILSLTYVLRCVICKPFVFFQVLPDAGVNPTTGTRAGSTAFYSLDEGKTRFYDIMQMVEFYTLNQGALNTRLSQVSFSPGIAM